MANLQDRVPVPVTNMHCGVATLGGGTVTIALPEIDANSIVLLSPQHANTGIMTYTITPGTGFVINSSVGGDAGAVSWMVIILQ